MLHFWHPDSIVPPTHVAFGVLVAGKGSTDPQEWNIVTSGPSILAGFGWNRDSIKPGDRVSIVCNPLSDEYLGSLAAVMGPSGDAARHPHNVARQTYIKGLFRTQRKSSVDMLISRFGAEQQHIREHAHP